jgi:hypothetical protein
MNDIREDVWTIAGEGTPQLTGRYRVAPAMELAANALPGSSYQSDESVTPVVSATTSHLVAGEALVDVLGPSLPEGTDLVSRIRLVQLSNAIRVAVMSNAVDSANRDIRLLWKVPKRILVFVRRDDPEASIGSVTPILEVRKPLLEMPLATDNPLQALAQLRRWLGLTYDQISDITGVSAGAFFYWKRKGATPYDKTSRPLWRFYTFAEALVRQLGSRGAKSWLHSGSPSPFQLLVTGDFAAAEGRAQGQLFQRQETQALRRTIAAEESSDAQEAEGGFAPRRRREPAVRVHRPLFDEE